MFAVGRRKKLKMSQGIPCRRLNQPGTRLNTIWPPFLLLFLPSRRMAPSSGTITSPGGGGGGGCGCTCTGGGADDDGGGGCTGGGDGGNDGGGGGGGVAGGGGSAVAETSTGTRLVSLSFSSSAADLTS